MIHKKEMGILVIQLCLGNQKKDEKILNGEKGGETTISTCELNVKCSLVHKLCQTLNFLASATLMSQRLHPYPRGAASRMLQENLHSKGDPRPKIQSLHSTLRSTTGK